MQSSLKAHYSLVQNIRALIASRGVNMGDVAQYAGHKPPWLSKILTSDRGMRLKDLDKIAAFFDLEVGDLFRPGIAHLLERRRGMPDRRIGPETRRIRERS
jgi:DNA-binding Xre family transcriptional regulator